MAPARSADPQNALIPNRWPATQARPIIGRLGPTAPELLSARACFLTPRPRLRS